MKVRGGRNGLGNYGEVEGVLGRDQAVFHKVLSRQLEKGDEVAWKRGRKFLEYRGETTPVTDIVFLVSGMGVMPVLSQLEGVLPVSGGASVDTTTVVWVNEKPSEFNLAYSHLSRQFYNYNRKLDVSCCVQPYVYSANLAGNGQSVESTPEFKEGTIAVIAGPDYFVKKANYFLQGRGYPSECICAMN